MKFSHCCVSLSVILLVTFIRSVADTIHKATHYPLLQLLPRRRFKSRKNLRLWWIVQILLIRICPNWLMARRWKGCGADLASKWINIAPAVCVREFLHCFCVWALSLLILIGLSPESGPNCLSLIAHNVILTSRRRKIMSRLQQAAWTVSVVKWIPRIGSAGNLFLGSDG